MASSNEHWPSMFKSNLALLITTNGNMTSTLLSFNKDPHAIQKRKAQEQNQDGIRGQSKYGYLKLSSIQEWKSRSKHKQRHLQAKAQQQNNTAPSNSSSSSSDKSSPNSTGHHHHNPQPCLPPPPPTHDDHSSSYHNTRVCFPDSTSFSHSSSSSSGLFLSEWMGISQTPNSSKKAENEKMNLQSQLMSYTVTSTPTTNNTYTVSPPLATTTTPTIAHLQGWDGAVQREEVFGEDAVLVHSSGEPLITNEWGLTLQPLQHDLEDELWVLKKMDRAAC
ncbi:sequence-specific DNA binding [Datura stramonium]|uniref:Sequence-specific DNA binding n=1 Tax=Datura stramonium TaxID=4076 RepID=A0ABS8W349_DATST|nr:sequence-specific DNA binding [Datura stramonium]